MIGPLLGLLALLLILSLILWAASYRLRRASGVPVGALVYRDTDRPAEPLFSSPYRLTGKPDYLLRQGRHRIPVEVKPGRWGDAPRPGDRLQLAAYCLLVEEADASPPPFGYIVYANTTFRVAYTPALRQELLNRLGQMRAALQATDVDRDHHDAWRCRACGFRERCEQRMKAEG